MRAGNQVKQVFGPNGEIALTIVGITDMVFLGTSVPTNAKSSDKNHTFIFCPQEEGVVAVLVNSSPFLLPIRRQESDGKFCFDLDRVYFPPVGMIYRFLEKVRHTNKYFMEVTVAGETFTTNPDATDAYIVSDADILCSLLAGDVTVDDVKAAATKHQEEVSAKETLDAIQQMLQKSEFALPNRGGSIKDQVTHVIMNADSLKTYLNQAYEALGNSAKDIGMLREREEVYKPIYDVLVECGLASKMEDMLQAESVEGKVTEVADFLYCKVFSILADIEKIDRSWVVFYSRRVLHRRMTLLRGPRGAQFLEWMRSCPRPY